MLALCRTFWSQGDKKFKKKTEEVPDASKKGPRELPRPKMRPTQSRDGLQKGPWDPRGAPEAQEAIFGCSKASFGSPFGRGMGSQFALKKQCFLHIFVLWNAPDFATNFNENMQKALFFQCKTALDALPGDPPGRAINSPCGSQMLLFDMNQAHPRNQKTRWKKEAKMKKQKMKKWNLHTSAAIRVQGPASLEKVSLKHSK